MFGLKIFVRVQTFRRVPPVLPCNSCHPGPYNNLLHNAWDNRWSFTSIQLSDKEQLFVSKIRQGRAAQYFPWTKPSQSPCGPHSGATEEKAVFVSCSCFPLSLLLQTMMCIKLIVSIICRKMWRLWSKLPCEVSVDYQVRQVPANLLCRGAAPPSQEPLVFFSIFSIL